MKKIYTIRIGFIFLFSFISVIYLNAQQNLSLNATITADSEIGASHPATNAKDNNITPGVNHPTSDDSYRWMSGSSRGENFLALDFGQLALVSGVDLFVGFNAGPSGNWRIPENLKVQYLDSVNVWKDIAATVVTGNSTTSPGTTATMDFSFTFTPVATKQLRYFTDNGNATDIISVVREFRAYGYLLTDLTRSASVTDFSSQNSNHPAANLIDNDVRASKGAPTWASAMWTSASGASEQWAEITLGQESMVNYVQFYVGNLANNNPRVPGNVKLQYWDGTAWVDLTGTALTGLSTSSDLSIGAAITNPQITSKVRVYSTAWIVDIREVFVYGKPVSRYTGTWNVAPTSGTHAILESGTLDNVSDLTLASLSVASGATVNVKSGATLNVTGAISNSGTFNVESGGSLIHYGGFDFTGTATISRNTTFSDAEGKYSFVGTPVAQSSSITGANLGTFVYKYDETQAYGADGSSQWVSASADELVPGRGYTQAFKKSLAFVGVPNRGKVTHAGTYTQDTDDAYEGFNLVANPYSAAISTRTFLDENPNTSGFVYIWDDNGSDQARGVSGDYVVANATVSTESRAGNGATKYSGRINSTQGFLVQLKDAAFSNNIIFNENMRVTGSNTDASFFREDGKANQPVLRINLTRGDELFRQAVWALNEHVDNSEFVSAADAPLMGKWAEDQVYFVKSDFHLKIMSSQEVDQVQLGFNIGKADSYTISAKLENIDYPIYLYDTQEDVYTDLSVSDYTFTATSGYDNSRFLLTEATSSILGTKLEQKLPFVYVYENTLHMKKGNESGLDFVIHDINGRMIQKVSMSEMSQEVSLGHLRPGVYFISNGKEGKKFIIK